MSNQNFPEETEYTKIWINDFDIQKANHYHQKFSRHFQKNIKHYQQIKFIKKYLKYDMKWLDAPIGSGRLMDSIQTKFMYGYDKSPIFVEMNRKKNIKTILGDLFDMPFKEEFDLITCLHTLFAFNNYKEILKQLIKSLKKKGILIFDIPNQNHINSTIQKYEKSPYNTGVNRVEIKEFFSNLGCNVLEIEPHDYYDNRNFSSIYKSKNKIIRIIYSIINFFYFKFNAQMQILFDKFSKGRNEKKYHAYLVAMMKIS